MPEAKLSAFAQSDLKDIWLYIAENDTETADGTVNEFFERFELLAHNAGLGRVRPDLLVGLRSFPHKRYIIFYFPTDDGVEIYRVLHSARDIKEAFEGFISGLPSTEQE